MVIGVFGKGGSGKTTVSTALVRFLHTQGNRVLAIDADHNMDLSYNLGHPEHPSPVGGQVEVLKEHIGIDADEHYSQAVMRIEHDTDMPFALDPLDPITERFSIKIEPKLRLMQTGPQTAGVLHGAHCSHYLGTPLKVYLPLLGLKENEWVIVDEKASADAVSTGIPTGMDVAIIVVEPREHSIKVARHIAEGLTFFEVPHFYLANKTNSPEEQTLIAEGLGVAPITHLPTAHEYDEALLSDVIRSLLARKSPVSRLARSQKKFARNEAFAIALG